MEDDVKKVSQRRISRIDKRQRILEAAISVFANKGYSNATIADVAKKAKIASGTVYLYFQNKDDLLVKCMHELMDSKLTEIKAEIENSPSAREAIYLFFVKHIELFTKNPDFARFMVVEIRQSAEFYERYPSFNPLNEYIEYVQALAEKAVLEKSMKDLDPRALALLIIGAMDLTLTQWLIGGQTFDLQTMTDNIRMILRLGTTP